MDSGANPAWGNRDALGQARTVVRPTAANPDLGRWRHGPSISTARKSVRWERWRAKGCAKPSRFPAAKNTCGSVLRCSMIRCYMLCCSPRTLADCRLPSR
jgi:hypothetical protein